MTIKEWCFKNIDIINKDEIQKVEHVLEIVKKLDDMPERIRLEHIAKNEKRLKELKGKPLISGIKGNSTNIVTNMILNEQLTSVKYVRKSAISRKQFIVLNDNIWILPYKKCYIFKKDNRSYVTDLTEVM